MCEYSLSLLRFSMKSLAKVAVSFALMQKKYPKEKLLQAAKALTFGNVKRAFHCSHSIGHFKTTALVGEPVVVQLKALNSLRSNSRAFLTLLFSFLSPSSLRSIIRFCETMLSQRSLYLIIFLSREV